MNTLLWILQILLVVAILGAGGMKLAKSREELQRQMAYVEDFSDGTMKGIGLLEVLGAVGLVLPALTGVVTVLTPLAAVGLGAVQIGAAITHARRGGEAQMIAVNVMFIVLLAVVAWGRFGTYAL